MKYLAYLASLAAASLSLSACTEKSDDTGSETDTTGASATTDDDATTSTTGDDTTSTTAETTPTSGGDTAETTGDETGTTTAPLDDDCAFLIGKKFVSQQKFPCGPPPDPEDPGQPLCPDQVAFDGDTFWYQSSDYGFSGTYTCAAGVITGEADGETYAGTIDADTGDLVWDGANYDVE